MTQADPVRLARALEDTQTEWGSSRWSTYRRCPLAHHLRYEQKVRKLWGDELPGAEAKPEYFGVGSLCHAVLRYTQESVIDKVSVDWEDVLEYASSKGNPPEVIDEAHRLMSHYWLHWGIENAGWGENTVIQAVEMYLETPQGMGEFPHTGRADTVLLVDGELVIVDTKTRKNGLPADLEDYERKLRTRPQFLSLAAMLQDKMGVTEPPSVMVNAISKTKLPKFGRVTVQFTNQQLQDWRQLHVMQAAHMAGTRHLPMANLDSCAPEMGSECEYFGKCHGDGKGYKQDDI